MKKYNCFFEKNQLGHAGAAAGLAGALYIEAEQYNIAILNDIFLTL